MRIFALLGFVLAVFIAFTCHTLFLTSRVEEGPHHPSTSAWFPLLAPISAMPHLFTPDEQAWITEHPVINVSLSPELFPMEDQGSVDAYTGISLDFLRIVSQITGLRFRTVPLSSWSEPLEDARVGRVDMFAMAEQRAPGHENLLFTTPYVSLPSVLVSPEKSAILGLDDLIGKTLAVRPGYFWEGYLKENYPGVILHPINSLQQGMLLVAQNQAAALVGYRFSMQRRLRASPNLALQLINLQDVSGLSMAVRRDLPYLASVLEKSLKHISGLERQVIYRRWLEANTPWGISSRPFLSVVLGLQVAAAGLLLVLFWNFQLRRKVDERTKLLAVELKKSARASALESLNAELRTAMVEAESAREAKGRFLANISHEIRTPLHGIISFTEMAYLRNRPLQRRHQSAILDLAYSLLDIVNDVLDFSRIEADAVRTDSAPFLLDDVIRRVCDMTVHSSRARELECVVDVNPATPMAFVGDAGRLQQILANLMGNAVKFTPAGGRIHLQIYAHAKGRDASGPDRVQLLFFVHDTGVGISPESLELLFRPFSQADSSLTRSRGGTGLGLSIAQHMVGKFGGEIWVESEPGVGSTFAFSLPFRLQEQIEALAVSPFVGLQALVVGTSDLGIGVLARTLEALGIHTATLQREDVAKGDIPYSPSVLVVDRLCGEDAPAPAFEVAEIIQRRLGMTIPTLLVGGPQEELAVTETRHTLQCPVRVARVVTPAGMRTALRALLGKGAHVGDTALPEAFQAVPDLSGARLLVVEDNLVNQEVMAALFEDSGATLRMASNGLEALHMVESEAFDLIFMDIQMPDMDGYATVSQLRQRGCTLPVVGITAHAMQADKQRCFDAGMNAYLSKPFKQSLLFETVRDLIPQHVRGVGNSDDTDAAASGGTQTGTTSAWDVPSCFSASMLQTIGLTPEGFRQVIASFVRSHADDENNMRSLAAASAARPSDMDETRFYLRRLRDLAHTLKGASANVGASELSHAALQLEREAGRRLGTAEPLRLPLPTHLLDEVAAALQAVLAAGRALSEPPPNAGEHDGGSPEKIANASMDTFLGSLEDALRQGAPELVRAGLSQLPRGGGMPWRTTLRLLAEQIDDYDYEAALLTLKTLRACIGTEYAD